MYYLKITLKWVGVWNYIEFLKNQKSEFKAKYFFELAYEEEDK